MGLRNREVGRRVNCRGVVRRIIGRIDLSAAGNGHCIRQRGRRIARDVYRQGYGWVACPGCQGATPSATKCRRCRAGPARPCNRRGRQAGRQGVSDGHGP